MEFHSKAAVYCWCDVWSQTKITPFLFSVLVLHIWIHEQIWNSYYQIMPGLVVIIYKRKLKIRFKLYDDFKIGK